MSDTSTTDVSPSRPSRGWRSLLRTVRGPFSALVLGGIGLLVPPQTADMLAALEDASASVTPIVMFHVALGILAPYTGESMNRPL